MASAIIRIILRRFFVSVPLVFIVVSVTFFVIRLVPGDPSYVLAGDTPTPEFLRYVRASYALDQSIYRQYLAFLFKAASGDLGTSIYFKKSVTVIILERFPATLLLTSSAMFVATLAGVWIAVTAAKGPGSKRDLFVTSISLVGLSVPTFWIGQVLILIFSVHLRLLPIGGMESARHSYTGVLYIADVAWHLILPCATLSLFILSMIARFTRTAMIDELDKDYIVVARAKGVAENAILWRHVFRVALTSTITVVGLELGAVIVGAVLVETICSWPGIGRLFYDAIAKRDFPLLTGSFIFTSVMVVLANGLTDVLCAIADPRLRK